MTRTGRLARAAFLAAALLAGCASGPKPGTGTTPPGGAPPQEGSSPAASAPGATPEPSPQGSEETPSSTPSASSPASSVPADGGSEASPAGGSSPTGAGAPSVAAGGSGGTKIVVPTKRERDIQKALGAATEALAAGEADALLAAGQLLVDSEAITLPEGALLAERSLSRFRELAPGRAADLIPVILKAHALLPGTAETYSALGRGYYQKGDFGPAESAAAAGLLLEPARVDLLLLRAEVLAVTDRWLQAERPLEVLLKAEPQNADALLLRATILWKYERDSRSAIEIVQNAFVIHPEDLRFPELQGRILHEQGQLVEARLVLNAVLARDPGRLDVVRLLLEDSVERAAWEDAQSLLDRLPAPSTEQDLAVAISVARGRGDTSRAAALAKLLDALAPDRRYAPLRARILLDAGDAAGAIALIGEALAVTKAGEVRSELLYLSALASGEPFSEEAARHLQSALAANPANSEAMFALARHYFAIGQMAKAQRYAALALRDRPDDRALAELLAKINAALAPSGGQ